MTVLRFTPPAGQKGISELIVGIGDPSKCCLQPKNDQKWFDVKAGDVLVSAEGDERTVLKVRLFVTARHEIAGGGIGRDGYDQAGPANARPIRTDFKSASFPQSRRRR